MKNTEAKGRKKRQRPLKWKEGGEEEGQGSKISAERAEQYVQADLKDTRWEKEGGRGKKRRRVMGQR